MEGAALADHDLGLDERPHALLEEERVALRALDQQRLEGRQVGRVAEERVEQLLGAGRRERIKPNLAVVGLAAPRRG